MFAHSPFLGFRTFILAALAAVGMYMDQHFAYFTPARYVLSAMVAPIRYLVDWPVGSIDWLQSSVSSHQALLAENAQLRSQLLLLRTKMLRLVSLEGENQQLRALLQSSTRANGRVLAAQLLSVSTDPLAHKLVLDKGKAEGVYLGQPVLDAFGVMGQVVQSGPWTSEVLLLSSRKSFIPVQSSRNGLRAIAAGTGSDRRMKLVDVPNTMDIQVGDVFVSSGLGLHYPVGYPVGTVTSVTHDPDQTFSVIYLKPAAYLDRSRQVLLVWPNMPRITEKSAYHWLEQGFAIPQLLNNFDKVAT